MTREELLQARLGWCTRAVRGLLKARFLHYGEYERSAAGQADAALRTEEEKEDGPEITFSTLIVKLVSLKAKELIEEWMRR